MMEQRLTSARIESRSIIIYVLRDSLTYNPLNLASTDPIALSIVTHISTALCALRPAHAAKLPWPKAALACSYNYKWMV